MCSLVGSGFNKFPLTQGKIFTSGYNYIYVYLKYPFKHPSVCCSLIFAFLTFSVLAYVLDNISLFLNEIKTMLLNVFPHTISVTPRKQQQQKNEVVNGGWF